MKTIDELMRIPYRIELVPDLDEGGYVAVFPDLPGCLTSGETLEEALSNSVDAKQAWFEAALEDGVAIPEPHYSEDYSGQFRLRMPKSLHYSLAQHAKDEGVSMNQYCIYLLSKNDALAHGME